MTKLSERELNNMPNLLELSGITKNKEGLYPCPFCGCKDELMIIDKPNNSLTTGISCPCGAEILGIGNLREEIERWNTRHLSKINLEDVAELDKEKLVSIIHSIAQELRNKHKIKHIGTVWFEYRRNLAKAIASSWPELVKGKVK